MSRSEMYKDGRTPLHTLRADIDYALAEALTKTGLIGIKFGFVKVWYMEIATFLLILDKSRTRWKQRWWYRNRRRK